MFDAGGRSIHGQNMPCMRHPRCTPVDNAIVQLPMWSLPLPRVDGKFVRAISATGGALERRATTRNDSNTAAFASGRKRKRHSHFGLLGSLKFIC